MTNRFPTKADGSADWSTAFYDDPEMAAGALAQAIKNDLRKEYQQEVGQAKFWALFDSRFPELRPERELVERIIKANLSELHDKPVNDQTLDRIAALARAQIEDETRRRKRSSELSVMRGHPADTGADADADKDWSMGSLLRARKDARRDAWAVHYGQRKREGAA